MIDRIRVRCPACRSAVPVSVLWAVGETCPRCSQPMNSARRLPRSDAVVAKTIDLLRAQAPGGPLPPEARRR